ncbi:hypothetical protein [Thorsellia anophelis]|uniref:Uncharacterized protein n=1 Tax=Thorsellia anophelis DSM 18579 TaxID=1123402 RepID=A0A1I0C085_9GAMM|nr:hypothetical protein [Thorsellia anophelis]SET12883.1 hypothetical protein SAMN02583745_01443 [Thorsellia anophelis DSM 18579]
MNITIPKTLHPYAINKRIEEECFSVIELQSSVGNQLFELHFFGDQSNDGYIHGLPPSFSNRLIVAKCIVSGEEIIIFDESLQGYDGMFCIPVSEDEKNNRPLKKLNFMPAEVTISFGYGIDYESEKEIYETNELGLFKLIDGRAVTFTQVQEDGFDWLIVSLKSQSGEYKEIINTELA